jgi:hypothetical protein
LESRFGFVREKFMVNQIYLLLSILKISLLVTVAVELHEEETRSNHPFTLIDK